MFHQKTNGDRIKKLDEERALNQDYINKKYQLLSQLNEEALSSDDDASTDASSKVQNWLQEARNAAHT